MSVLNEQAWVEFDFGADGLVTDVRWANESPQPIRLMLYGKNDTLLGDVTLQPGQTGNRRLVGGQRFHVEDDTGQYRIAMGILD